MDISADSNPFKQSSVTTTPDIKISVPLEPNKVKSFVPSQELKKETPKPKDPVIEALEKLVEDCSK